MYKYGKSLKCAVNYFTRSGNVFKVISGENPIGKVHGKFEHCAGSKLLN